MVKPNRLVWFILGGLVLVATLANAQSREGIRTEVTLRGTVSAIDYKARTVTLRTDKGDLATTDIPVWATRFEQVKVGGQSHGVVLRPGDHPSEASGRTGC